MTYLKVKCRDCKKIMWIYFPSEKDMPPVKKGEYIEYFCDFCETKRLFEVLDKHPPFNKKCENHENDIRLSDNETHDEDATDDTIKNLELEAELYCDDEYDEYDLLKEELLIEKEIEEQQMYEDWIDQFWEDWNEDWRDYCEKLLEKDYEKGKR